MTRQSQLFVAAPILPDQRRPLADLLDTMTDAPGQADPLNQIVPFGLIRTIHVARFIILDDPSLADRVGYRGLPPEEPVYLALVAEADGSADALLDALVEVAAPGLRRLFGHCEGFANGDDVALRAWLAAHRIRPAASYVNMPGRTVAQVREEAELHRALRAERLRHPHLAPEDLLPALRRAVQHIPLTSTKRATLGERVREIGHVLLLLALLAVALPLLVVLAPALLVVLRRHEKADDVIAPRPLAERNRLLASYEDHDLTNQYSAIGSLKPGLFRRWLTIVVLWLISLAARQIFNRGRLGRVNTIQFASWTFLDHRRRIYFASNYDGSREAYNDDFINKVAFGLNMAFSNGLGYPRTRWLVLDGARHEQDFKRFLFHHQLPTDVWYKANRGLTTYDMARNTRIRKGLARPLAGDALRRWLAEI